MFRTMIAAIMAVMMMNAPAHAFFGLFDKEEHEIIFHDVVDISCNDLPGKVGYGYEEVINEKRECQIKKIFVNGKGQLEGVNGDWFYIVVQVEDKAELVTMNVNDFRKLGKEKAVEELKNRIKAKVKAMVKAELGVN